MNQLKEMIRMNCIIKDNKLECSAMWYVKPTVPTVSTALISGESMSRPFCNGLHIFVMEMEIENTVLGSWLIYRCPSYSGREECCFMLLLVCGGCLNVVLMFQFLYKSCFMRTQRTI